jgi:prepilin-type processing-associated H-X9-DG protein
MPGESDLGRFYLARHGQAVNVAFLDGHAEQVPLNRIRKFRWSSSEHAKPPEARFK